MRNLLFALTVLLGFSVTAQDAQQTWQTDLNAATERAQTENKPILVYFTKDHCKACQQFYTDFLNRKDFASVADAFILLMMEASDRNVKTNDLATMKQQRWMAHYNKPSAFPALLAIDQNGKELGDLFTAKDEAAYASYVAFLKTL